MKYVAENYKNFYDNMRNESSYGSPAPVVLQIPDTIPPGSVLDLGAGDGRHALFLAARGFQVNAVDISEAGLEKLQRRASEQRLTIETHVVDLAHWSIDRDYNAIVAVVVFQHLAKNDALRLLDEMKQHTTSGGVNAVTVFTKTGDRYDQDRKEDPDAFYPDDGWLKKFYADWNIVEYESTNGALIGKFRDDGTPMMNVVEKILAQKPPHR